MAWSTDIDDLIASGQPIPRSYILEMRNGYQTCEDEYWVPIPIKRDGWSITVVDGNPVVGNMRCNLGIEDFSYFDEFDMTNPAQLFADCRLTASVTTPIGIESNQIFRGTARTPQIIDGSILIDVVDPLEKLKTSHAPTDLEASILGPYPIPPSTGVRLRHNTSGIWDAAGTFYTYEIDPTWLLQTWSQSVGGVNRTWVPSAITVEIWRPLIPAFEPMDPSEYIIDTALGLVRFHEDQGGLAIFQIQNVSVYVEGTLELADVVEYILTLPDQCEADPANRTLGCGFGQADLTINLTGLVTFVNAPPFQTITGIGTDFQGELEIGDRVALHASNDIKGIIDFINPGLQIATIKYPYDQIGGTPGDNGAAFKSTLMESGVNLTKIKFLKCEGMAADLYRKLQEYYADSKGYKIWYDYENNQIVGKQVGILYPPDARIIDLPPVVKNGLKLQGTTEDFGTAVTTTGIVGRSKNLIRDAGVTITDLSLLLPPTPPGGFSWLVGPSTGGAPQFWYGLWYNLLPVPNLNDANLSTGYAVYHNYQDWAPRLTAFHTYFPFLEIDLQGVFDLGTIVLHRINSRPVRKEETMGVDILGSVDGITYDYLSPEAVHYEMGYDETKTFDFEGLASVRYIRIDCRPLYWVDSGKELTMGFREIQIYGSQTICEVACIQEDIAHGQRQNGTGNITFNAAGPPYTITGAGTNFGGVGEPQVGDYIAHAVDLDHWGIIDVINAPTGANCVELVFPYNGVLPSAGALRFSDGTGPYEEGEGGHFIGGNPVDAAFIRDYYPYLVHKTCAYGHRVKFDNENIVYTEMQAKDRAYLILDEVIRLYRMISTRHGFEIRPNIFDTVHAIDDYRITGDEDLYYLVQSIVMSDKGATYSGTEYGAGVLR